MSASQGKSRASGLNCIADGFIQSDVDRERASNSLAEKIALFQPTRQELNQLGVSDKLLRRGFELLRHRGRKPKAPGLQAKFLSARQSILAELPAETTKRRRPGRTPVTVSHIATH